MTRLWVMYYKNQSPHIVNVNYFHNLLSNITSEIVRHELSKPQRTNWETFQTMCSWHNWPCSDCDEWTLESTLNGHHLSTWKPQFVLTSTHRLLLVYFGTMWKQNPKIKSITSIALWDRSLPGKRGWFPIQAALSDGDRCKKVTAGTHNMQTHYLMTSTPQHFLFSMETIFCNHVVGNRPSLKIV